MKKFLLVAFFLVGTSINTFPAVSIATIERAFLLNQVSLLKNILPEEQYLSLSFPPPLSFSDTFSPEQTYLIFSHIFSRFKTQEFYSIHLYTLKTPGAAILKTRWAFQDKQTNKRYVLDVYFFLKTTSARPTIKDIPPEQTAWEIIEIKGFRR